MHDPMTVAFEIKWPWWWMQYRPPIVTIWHVDPERDGSDDSCGWFMRARHCDQDTLKKITKDFEFHWKSGVPTGWFADNGEPNYSSIAIVLGMFRIAANDAFGHWSGRSRRFLRRHAFDILCFAENSCDSMFTFIHQSYGRDERDTAERRAAEAAQIVYSWICRADRPWYKHPRWHVWHWKIQVHAIQKLKRWMFSRCELCGKRFGYGECPVSNSWNGTGPLWFRSEKHVRHGDCNGVSVESGIREEGD